MAMAQGGCLLMGSYIHTKTWLSIFLTILQWRQLENMAKRPLIPKVTPCPILTLNGTPVSCPWSYLLHNVITSKSLILLVLRYLNCVHSMYVVIAFMLRTPDGCQFPWSVPMIRNSRCHKEPVLRKTTRLDLFESSGTATGIQAGIWRILKHSKAFCVFLWFSAKWILNHTWMLAKWILDWGHQES